VIGNKRAPSSIASDHPKKKKDCSVDKSPKEFVKGDYVLLKCHQYKEWIPQIGQVLSIDEATVKIKWMDGSIDSKWSAWKYGGRQVRVNLPRKSIIREITFNKNMKLKEADIKKIDMDYKDIEYV